MSPTAKQSADAARERISLHGIGQGVRLLQLTSSRFSTTFARVVLQRPLQADATGPALLARVLEQATEDSPTRRALGDRLADLYGASLSAQTTRLGVNQLLGVAMDWPHVLSGSPARALEQGLALLAEVLFRPLRGPDGSSLDAAIVGREQENHRRTLAALADDLPRHALRRAVGLACPDEAYRFSPGGRLEDVGAWDPARLGRLHADLLARAPMDILVASPVSPLRTCALVERHLLPAARRPRARTRPLSLRDPRARLRRVVESGRGEQARVVLIGRAKVRPGTGPAAAAETFAALLGGASYGAGWRVLREQAGLCYDVSAEWVGPMGMLVFQAGCAPKDVAALIRGARRLARGILRGEEIAAAQTDFLEAVREQDRMLADRRAARLAFAAHAGDLGMSPDPAARAARLAAVRPAHLRAFAKRFRFEASYVLEPETTR